MDELLRVLWAYRTTARRPTGISLFALPYRMEAIVLTEIGMPMLQANLPELSNAESVIKDLDTADELHESAVMQIALYDRMLSNLYNRRVKPRTFQPGDLVLRKIFENITDPLVEKFQPNWEGPYIVTRAGESGSYALHKLDGKPVPRMWNVMHLKR